MKFIYKVITQPISDSEQFNDDLAEAMNDGFAFHADMHNITTVSGSDDTWLVATVQKFVK